VCAESGIEEKTGQCVDNAVKMSEPPVSFCKSDGTWLYFRGGCQCMAGYEPDKTAGAGQASYRPFRGIRIVPVPLLRSREP
jgi:hypothetical protein